MSNASFKMNGVEVFSENAQTVTMNSGVVFPAGSIVGWEQVTTVPTSIQGSDLSYTDVTGSSKNYTPATGSSYVVYEYATTIQGDGSNSTQLPLFKFIYDGSEVANTNHGLYIAPNSANQGIGYYTMRFILNSWSGSKNVKLQYRAWAASESFMMHKSTQSGNASSTDVFTNIYQVIYSVM